MLLKVIWNISQAASHVAYWIYLSNTWQTLRLDILFEEQGEEELARTLKDLRDDQIGNHCPYIPSIHPVYNPSPTCNL
jgi:hypothetical protein